MRNDMYIIDDQGVIKQESDLRKWGEFMQSKVRIVKQENFGRGKKIMVSTVFLGLDHNWTQTGEPVLWETMVFGGKLDQEQDRCSGTKQDALAMHKRMVNRVKGTL